MTFRLTLLRHAKSSWDDINLRDFDRPLAPRGIKAAPKIGKYMAENDILPEYVWCSSARRTTETFARIQSVLPVTPHVRYDDMIYSAGTASGLVNLIRSAAPEVSHLMIVGHNPTMQDMVLSLVGWQQGQAEHKAQIQRKFSTGALANIDFEMDGWSDIDYETGRLCHFVTPKML